MKKQGNTIIIGIDHGYGYIKSAGTIMKSGIEEYPIKPPFTEDILEVDRQVFVAGQIRAEHTADKTKNKDYYYLTLVSLAKELREHNMHEAKNVILAVGLPYSFFAIQKDSFREYLMQKKTLSFTYEGEKYKVEIKDVHVYPQGLPVLATEMNKYQGKTISVVDIGSRTIDVITYRNGKPFYELCFSVDKKGTLDCIDNINKYYLGKYAENVDEEDVQLLFQKKNSSITGDKSQFVKDMIKIYAKDVMKLLEAKIPGQMIVCGGGASVIKNYHGKTKAGMTIIEDIYCNAKGYEVLTYNRLKSK